MTFGSDFAANESVERDDEGDHDFVIAGFLGVLEQVLYDRLMAGTIQRLRKIGQQLFACPGTRIFLPAIRKRSKRFRLIGFANGFEKGGIFSGEVFFRQEHLTAVRLRRSHG